MDSPVHYAGFWRRFAAACIDLLIFTPGYVALRYALPRPPGLADGVFILLALALYAWLFSSGKQGSPGMWAMRFRIADTHGKRISFSRALWWGVTSAAGWLAVGAGVLYLQARYDLDAINACLNAPEAEILPGGQVSCGLNDAASSQVFGPGGYQTFLFWAMLALGGFFAISLLWAFSIGLSKEKAGFHNVLCGTRFILRAR
jgi:uncharacterized RDD family membrane protein YckC